MKDVVLSQDPGQELRGDPPELHPGGVDAVEPPVGGVDLERDREGLIRDQFQKKLKAQKMNDLMNRQIGNEMGASMQYIAIAGHFAGQSLSVFTEHFMRQAEEEREHAMKFVHYILETGGKVVIPAIPAPKATFKDAEEAVRLSLDWEQTVTAQINDLMKLAVKEDDFASQGMLQWFVTEQIEEVSSMDHLLHLVQRAGEKNLFFVEGALARARAAKKD